MCSQDFYLSNDHVLFNSVLVKRQLVDATFILLLFLSHNTGKELGWEKTEEKDFLQEMILTFTSFY